MGTLVGITLYGPDTISANNALQSAFKLIDSLNLVFSDYDNRSEVFKINNNRRKSIIKISPMLYELLATSLTIANQSHGRFDPTLGRLTHLWRKYKDKNKLPSRRKLKRAQNQTGYDQLSIDDGGRIKFNNRKLMLDFGGIAKGFIADQIAKLFSSQHLNSYLVDMGGDFLIGAPPPGLAGWTIASSICTEPLLLSNVSIGVSGAMFQFLVHEEEQFSHILSKEKPAGLGHQLQTYVMAADATTADAWATALNVAKNSWFPMELINLEYGFFIHSTDHTFVNHFNKKLRPQLNSCR